MPNPAEAPEVINAFLRVLCVTRKRQSGVAVSGNGAAAGAGNPDSGRGPAMWVRIPPPDCHLVPSNLVYRALLGEGE